MCVWVADTESETSLWKLWGTLRFHLSGAKTPHLRLPVVCLITFSQTLGNCWVLQLYHACGLMRFLNPILWNCHRLFVRKRLPREYSRLKFGGMCILIIILCNYKNTTWLQLHATSVFCIRFKCTWVSLVLLFLWASLRGWKVVLPSSLNLKHNGFLIKTKILTWNELIDIDFLSLWMHSYCMVSPLLCSHMTVLLS